MGVTADMLLQKLREETKINHFFAMEKLPATLREKTDQVRAFQGVLQQPNVSRDDLAKLENQVRELNFAVGDLRDRKMKERQE